MAEHGAPSGAEAGGDAALVQRSVNTIRTLAMDMVEQAGSGHPGTPMGLAPLAYALWTRVLRYDAGRPDWPDRDRFVLSCGHASALLYAVLHLTGHGLAIEDLKAFRQWGSATAGHPERGHAAGVETTTGPLGQGFANAVGMALAERLLASRFNRPGHTVVDHRTWVIASDGDLMEGVSQEAASLAGHLGLSRLCVFYDDNRITIDGSTDLTFTEDVEGRFLAYGWKVLHVGLDALVEDYVAAASRAREETERPTLVICRTHIGHGAPTKQDRSSAHGAPLGAEELRGAKANLGWPPSPPFLVPADVHAHLGAAGRRGAASAAAWDKGRAAYRAAYPAEDAELERALALRLPEGWSDALPSFAPGPGLATRQSSKRVLNALKDVLPELVGGSADLAGSNGTWLDGEGVVGGEGLEGRNVHFGVREHAMGAMLNGIALHGGWRPFGGTFLVFSDYMRPAIRLAALMRLRVVFVFTHDSIGVGEDGPTHQPVEHLAALRAIPGLQVIRPCDGAETAEAWRVALDQPGPTALILSRQVLPEAERSRAHLAAARGLAEGAYVLTPAVADPDVVLLASGSEVPLALGAATILAGEGVRARVVSFPCWERFAARPAAEREAVLGGEAVRVAVEAASSLGWHRWVGPRGALVTLDRFGASAPAERLQEVFGFTPANVAAVARQALASSRAASGPTDR